MSRGLANLRNTPAALATLKDETKTAFLTEFGIFKPSEINARYNVLVERYNMWRNIEFNSLIGLVQRSVFPRSINELCKTI